MSAQPEHGSLADETARLFEALQQAASGWNHDDGPAGHGHPTETPAACRVCPLCRLVAAVQNVRPETVQHLADAAASLAAAFADVVTAGEPARPGRPGRRGSEPRDVQHIDITD